jgi:hypothetical protein
MMLASTTAHCGAWGPGPFQNDDALDWLGELAGANDASVLVAALTQANSTAYVEAPQCSAALAAAEFVAAAAGRPMKNLPDAAAAWLRRVDVRVTPKLLSDARMAVTICLDHERSELEDLWFQSPKKNTWRSTTEALLKRLQSPIAQLSVGAAAIDKVACNWCGAAAAQPGR